MAFDLKEFVTVSLTLFAVIDILGAIPVVLNLKKQTGDIHAGKATIVSGIIMIAFLFIGQSMLKFIGIDVQSFALAGSIVIFLIGLEMILGIVLFKPDPDMKDASIVPLAFPLIAGAGTMTTILALKADYNELNILLGIVANVLFVYLVLRFIPFIEKKLGNGGIGVLRRIFGVLLLAIAIKIFKGNLGLF